MEKFIPEYGIQEIVSVKNQKDPIFFIRERKFFRQDPLGWRYFGSYFNIEEGEVVYQITSSYISESFIKPIKEEF